MSKAGVVQMTKAMAAEWGPYGINVNAICPGYISTEINEENFETDQGKKLIDLLPRKRVGKPEDWTGCCCWRRKRTTSSTARSSRPMTA